MATTNVLFLVLSLPACFDVIQPQGFLHLGLGIDSGQVGVLKAELSFETIPSSLGLTSSCGETKLFCQSRKRGGKRKEKLDRELGRTK